MDAPSLLREAPVFRRAIAFTALVAAPLVAQKAPLAGFDDYVARTMKDWKDPGLAIGIIRNDTVIFTKGYGTRTPVANVSSWWVFASHFCTVPRRLLIS